MKLLDYNEQQVVRELSLFACNDHKLSEQYFMSIGGIANEARSKSREHWHVVYRAVFNTIPLILLRYHVVFGGIGCRLSLLARLVLAVDLTRMLYDEE